MTRWTRLSGFTPAVVGLPLGRPCNVDAGRRVSCGCFSSFSRLHPRLEGPFLFRLMVAS
jgi:hypothetical protein